MRLLAFVTAVTVLAHPIAIAIPTHAQSLQAPSHGSTQRENTNAGNVAITKRCDDRYCKDMVLQEDNDTTWACSPFSADCLDMVRNIGGTWTISYGSHQLVQHETCALNVTSHDMWNTYKVRVTDVRDAVIGLVAQNERNGFVGGSGWFDCRLNLNEVRYGRLNFSISHNNDTCRDTERIDTRIRPLPSMSGDAEILARATDVVPNAPVPTGAAYCSYTNYRPEIITTVFSPLAADCLQMAKNIPDASNFVWIWQGTHQVAQYGTCALWIQNLDGVAAKLGYADATRVVVGLLSLWTKGDYVSGGGEFLCTTYHVNVTQTIYFDLHKDNAQHPGASEGPHLKDPPKIRSLLSTREPVIDDHNSVVHCWNDWIFPDQETTQASPLVADCRQMLANIASDGDWVIGSSLRQVVQYKTCVFSARVPDGQWLRISNGDIIRVANKIIEETARGDRVGGQGEMNCYSIALGGITSKMSFSIWRNPAVSGPEPEPVQERHADTYGQEAELVMRDSDGTVDCSNEDYQNKSSNGSPLVSDCQQMVANIASDGEWHVLAGTHQIIEYKTCAFGIISDALEISKIGNGDVTRVVNKAIEMFQWNGKVGARGYWTCKDLGVNPVHFQWTLYHN